MKIGKIMHRDVQIMGPEESLRNAAIMKRLDTGVLPVGERDKLVGMITDRDITIRATAEGRDPKTTVVRDCLSSELVYGFEGQDLEDAQTLMEQKQIRRLPVMSSDKELVGIVALGDLAAKVGAAMVGQATQAISSSKS